MTFAGFPKPKRNYSQLPHALVDMLPEITSLSELKVVLYTLRHTWGFSEYGKPKRLTIDEFMNGRKRTNGSRYDRGTGLSNNSVINGLRDAEEHGFVVIDVDDHDKGRIKKYYRLKIDDSKTWGSEPQDLKSDMQNVHSYSAKDAHRTEKDTLENNQPPEEQPRARIFRLYEELCGQTIGSFVYDELKDAQQSYPAEWIEDAFKEAMLNNAKSWKYVRTILERWSREGRVDRKGASPTHSLPPNERPGVHMIDHLKLIEATAEEVYGE